LAEGTGEAGSIRRVSDQWRGWSERRLRTAISMAMALTARNAAAMIVQESARDMVGPGGKEEGQAALPVSGAFHRPE
jgi:hypothetical protein